MKYFETGDGKIWAFEDDFDGDLPDTARALSEVDALARVTSPPTPEQIIAQYTGAVQQHLDTFARTRNYDGILSAATYATSQVPKFKAEGQYAVEARDATWAKCYEVLAEVEAGSRPMPTLDELLTELPVLAWPN